MRKSFLLCALLLSACAPETKQPLDVSLQPYLTSTSAPSSTPNIIVVIETPVPTNTPFIYIVEAGDTLSEIAEKFKISQDKLRAANPDVSPNSMSIGMTLIIPDPSSAIASASTPTPVPVPITQTVCHPSADNGLWCFALIQNNSAKPLENISAQITLLDENNNAIASQTAFTPLDMIPSSSSLPVYVFFPDTSANANMQVQLLSAIQSDNSRYLPATLNNTVAQIDWSGKSAQLSGQILLPAESQAATRVWVAAVAYDRHGQVVGIKRWEGGAIQTGGSIAFSFSVASLGGVIEAVEFVVQANP
ncbi:MAG: LysM peptidoglycan-binding domain-containing protein [Chloroflexi bacterium]|nr:LysM peptidoglycan-binding domain-containing protein [Chloroflexota bacterium]